MSAAATAPRAVVGPTVFARIGGLPADAVPGASPEVVDCLDRLHDVEERLDSLTQPLIDRIFELVPGIEDNKVRRLVLQAKREVFAGRAVAARAERALRATAPSGLLSAFEEWSEQLDRREALDAALREALAADDAEMLRALDRTVADPGYLASLALATPELVARLLARRPSRAPSERLVRSLYNYATRTALKTSPFSGLTTVNIAGADGRGRSARTVAVHLASGLLRRAAHDGALHPGLVLESSPMGSVPAEEHDRLVMLAQYVHQDGIIFRDEFVTGAEWAPTDYPDSFAPGTPTGRMRRHVEAGLLRERVPWRRGQAPLEVLSSVFPEGIGGVGADDMLGAGRTGRDCASTGADGRVRAMRRLAEFSSRVFDRGELGRRPGGLLYEDREAPWAVPDVLSAPGFREDLEDLSELMAPWVFRSHAYDLMVERFVARYGVGGRCDSPLSFCMALAVDNDGDRELSAAFVRNQRYDVEQAVVRSTLACGATAAPRHLGVMLQILAPGWEGLNGCDHLVVLNNTGSGVGAYQARFHRLFGESFRQDLEAEINGLWPTRTVLELTAWADCNTGQAVCTGVLPELQLPGEPRSPRGVPLESLSLIHDPVTDSLELWDDDGPVGLAYLGLTPQHLLNTYLRWVALLADPWVRFPPHTEAYAALMSGYKRLAEGAIEYEPRRMEGRRLITRRESWLMSAPTLLDAARDGDGLSVRRIDELRRRHHLPPRVFVQQLAAGGGTTNDRRKPQFVDLASRTSLASLGHWLDPATRVVRITEALPGAGEHHVNEWSWRRPPGGPPRRGGAPPSRPGRAPPSQRTRRLAALAATGGTMNPHERDWLYVKVYSGQGDDVGALLPAVLEWKASLHGADRWHFLRYMDSSGHHLRVRLRGRAEDVDDWYRDLPRLERLARRESGRTMTRIIHDPMVERAGRRSGVSVCLYSPELAKYGGPEGMEDTEILFQKSSQACADNRVWTWSPLERLMAAIDYIGAVEREGGFEPGALSARIADRWADRLRYGGLYPDKVRHRSPTLNERVRARARPPADWTELVLLTSGVLAARTASAAPEFPLDLVHMHINRLGLNPLEECLAAHLCTPSPTTTQGDTHHDRPEPRS